MNRDETLILPPKYEPLTRRFAPPSPRLGRGEGNRPPMVNAGMTTTPLFPQGLAELAPRNSFSVLQPQLAACGVNVMAFFAAERGGDFLFLQHRQERLAVIFRRPFPWQAFDSLSGIRFTFAKNL